MMSMDDFTIPAATPSAGSGSWLTVRIIRTEENVSMMMQRFTAYIVEVSDFGRNFEVSHRYSDFEALHRGMLADCPGINLPPMPPKGVDGSDMAVVAMRKVELEKILRFMIACPEVLMEKSFGLWKFLNLPNPAVVAGRFVAVPRSRAPNVKTLAKLADPKYKDDVYRLGHVAMTDLLIEALREFSRGSPDSGHWCHAPEGRTSVCQLLACALGINEARRRLLDVDVVGLLLGIVERDESALDDARTALNVVVAREAERFGTLLASFLRRGGLVQLTSLAMKPKSQEFVAKLLWLAWDAPAREPFSQPGGQGLKLLQALMHSEIGTCSLLGGVLLAGLVAGGAFDADPSHRTEALRMVRSVLARPDAASDAQFTKTLCGANAALVRLASLIEDVDLAPLILGLLCAARPPAAKLGRISGNLASLVSDKGNTGHSEETKAKAAELLLHIQGTGASPPAGAGQSAGTGAGAAPLELDRCEGIAEHEESLEAALRQQLVDAVAKSRQALETQATGVQQIVALAGQRLQVHPEMDFGQFDKCFASYKISREALEKLVGETRNLHHDMERQMLDLSGARPSSVDPVTYKERLLAAERIYGEVKSQRSLLAEAEADLKAKQNRAEASAAECRQAGEEARRCEDELRELRLKKSERESEATRLRHRASTPSLSQMKQQVADSIEKNLQEAKHLQVIGQRVNQGDPDYLKDGESRDQKIAELSTKLQQLKKQHQSLLQQQKELDFDPTQLFDQASKLEAESREMQTRMDSLEAKRLESDRTRSEKTSTSEFDAAEARAAQEKRTALASRLSASESEARSQMSSLQPMIQEHHSGWQRLLGQQKKLDSDRHLLSSRIEDASRAADNEAMSRTELGTAVQGLIDRLVTLQSFLRTVEEGSTAPPAPAPSAEVFNPPSRAAPAPSVFSATDEDPFDLPAPSASVGASDPFALPVPAASASQLASGLAPSTTSNAALDEFDAFLQEDPDMTFGASLPAAKPVQAAAPAPEMPAAPPAAAPAAPQSTSSALGDFGEL